MNVERLKRKLLGLAACGVAILLQDGQPALGGIVFTIEDPGVQHSSVTNVTTENFNSGSPGPFAGTVLSGLGNISGGYKIGTNGGVGLYMYGGADKSQFYGIGNWSGTTTATLTFNSPQNYFGLWWSAGDGANQLVFYDTNNILIGSYFVGDIIPFLSASYFGNPNYSPRINTNQPYVYLNFTTTSTDQIASVQFLNTTVSGFEIDNISVTDQSVIPPGHDVFAPKIAASPQSLTNLAGTTASFTVTATGTAPLNYQWRFNGNNLANSGRVSGATSTNLTITGVQLADAGNYTVVVTNAYGAVTSSVAVLTVTNATGGVPLPSGCVAWWRGESNGLDCINTNHGSISGGIGYADGMVGQAFSFDGTTAELQVAPSMSLDIGGGAGMTFETWIRVDAFGNMPIFLWAPGTSVASPRILLAQSWYGGCGDGNLGVELVGPYFCSAGGTFQTNTFYHLALTYDRASGQAYVYRNAQVIGTLSVGQINLPTTYPIFLGGSSYGFNFNGLIDEPALYSRALSSSEIAAIYQAGSAGKSSAASAIPALTFTTPTSGSVFTGSGYSFGWQFALSNSIQVTALGCFDQDGDGLNTPRLVTLWDNAGNLVCSGTVDSADPLQDGFRYTSTISGTTNLAAGTYTIAAYFADTADLMIYNASRSAFTNASPVNYIEGRYGGGYATIPTEHYEDQDEAYFGPNFQFTVGSATGAAPSITGQPATQTNVVGSSITFVVTATGTSPLAYQWCKEGVPISAATDSLLSLSPSALSHAGRYTVIITNSAGSITSAVASLTIDALLPVSNMVWIPSGTFLMGSPASEQGRQSDEGPQTEVTLSRGFFMSRFEVTQTEYVPVMANNPSYFQGNPNLPVEQVTWNDATNYCGKLTQAERTAGRLPAGWSYRLPTEAQWEYACRAGTTTRFYFGDDPSYTQLTNYVWYERNSAGTSHPVGQKPPNRWGLYDMSGNVWEWCADHLGTYPGGSVTDPAGSVAGAESRPRGGSWFGYDFYCRSANRDAGNPPYRNDFGFRVVLAPEPGFPAITSQPQSQTVGVGSNATFTATAIGAAPLAYQWRRGAAPISGATTSSYTLSNVQLSDAGNYTVVVTNAYGSVTSAVAMLTVTPATVPPAITQAPQSQTVLDGQSVAFNVIASGTPPLAYQWRKNGMGLPGATTSSYTIASADLPDAGSYVVVVTNTAGAVTSTPPAVLTVNVSPRPDLVVTAANGPVEAWSDYPFDVSWTVANSGQASALGSWVDRVYLSSDAALGGDILLGSYPYSEGLAAGQTVARRQSVGFGRSGIANGNYWVIVATDADNSVVEKTGEGNNVRVSAQPVNVHLTPLPNLLIESITAPTNVFSGQKITVRWTVRNRGPGAPDTISWNDQVFLSVDTNADNSDYWQKAVPNTAYVSSNEAYVASAEVEVPINAFGNYHIIVKTDSGNTVREDDESNNVTNRLLSVTLSPSPDLQVAEVSAPSFGFSGLPVPVSWTTKNMGLGPVIPFQSRWSDSVVLSSDTNLDSGDLVIASIGHVGILNPGESYKVTNQWAGIPDGFHGVGYIFVVADQANQVWEHVYENNNDRCDPQPIHVYLTPPPDLTVCSVHSYTEWRSAPGGTPETGIGIYPVWVVHVDWRTCNWGAGDTVRSAWNDAVYLSTDGNLDASDILLGQVPHGDGLVAGGSYSNGASFTLPSNLTGQYRIIVVTDPSQTSNPQAGNVGVTELPVDLPLLDRPDLRVLSVQAATSAIAGQALTVQCTLTNAGTFSALPAVWYDQLGWAKPDGSGQRALANISSSHAIPPGVAVTLTNVVTIPEDASGEYRLYAVADSASQVDEGLMETNNGNWATSLIHVDSYPPDLRVTSIAAPATAESGHPITVTWIVANQGLSNLVNRSWSDSVYLSRFPDSLNGAISLGSAGKAGSLALGISYTNTLTATLPYRLSGQFYVHVQLDSGNAVFEGAGETNNLVSSAVIPGGLVVNVTQTPMPDLVVASVLPPSGGYAGREVTVTWTVRNSGMAHTAQSNWVDTIYLSKDQVFDSTDPQVGYLWHGGGLLQNQSYTTNTTVRMPRDFVGPCYVFVGADKQNQVFELNEDNNRGASTAAAFYTLPPPADLTVTSITMPASGISGQPVTVNWAVKNQGLFPAEGTWVDTLYLSANDLWDIDDALLGRVTHTGPLAIGASYSQTLTNSLPGLTPGGYRVIVRTDIMNNVRESDESNNAGISAGMLTNDVIELTLGQPYTNVLATGDNHFYKVQVPAGETLAVNADSRTTNAWNELFTRFDAMPSRADYDYLYEQPFLPDVGVTVPETTNGWYYNLFRTEYSQTNQQNYQIEADLIPFSITSVYPTNIGDNGQVTLTIKGAQFRSDTTVSLVSDSNPTLTSSNVQLLGPTELKVRFRLANIPHGTYRVTLSQPSHNTVTNAAPVTVSKAQDASASLALAGPLTPRFGQPLLLDGSLINEGNVDTPYVLVAFNANSPGIISLRGLVNRMPGLSEWGVDEWLPMSTRDTMGAMASILLRNVEAGERIPFSVKMEDYDRPSYRLYVTPLALSTAAFLDILANIVQSGYDTLVENPEIYSTLGVNTRFSSFEQYSDFCRSNLVVLGIIDADASLTLPRMARGSFNGPECSKGINEMIVDTAIYTVGASAQVLLWTRSVEKTLPWAVKQARFLILQLRAMPKYIKNAPPGIKALLTFLTAGLVKESSLESLEHLMDDVMALYKLYQDFTTIPLRYAKYAFQNMQNDVTAIMENCIPHSDPCSEVKTEYINGQSFYIVCANHVRPRDPNEILGPTGYGDGRFLHAQYVERFSIFFENVPSASSAAQTVRVRNQLPPTLDWRTFRLNEIVFGTNVISIPANRSYYQTRVNLGPGQNNLLADVIAGIDIRTGQAFCTLSAIDPATGEAPEDPQLGLLPPNNTNHIGEGHITYTIKPKTGQPTGTLITNQAAITFDIYETILTGIWTNTLDAFAPTSRVVSLPAQMNQLTFDVSWFGWDETNGSGVASYDVFLSDNGGDWTLWQSATTTNSAAFTGVPGHNYAFYTVARDNVGNVETKTAQAEAATTLAGGLNSPPVFFAMSDQTVTDGQEVVVPLIATDADTTNQTLTFSFAAPAPSGAVISQAERLFRWTPTLAQAPSTNVITIKVVDNATPSASATQSFTVYVEKAIRAPLVQGIPGNQRVMIGGQATFAASFLGFDPLAFQWRFKGATLPNQTNATLVLSNVQPSQAGEYRLTATNTYGSVTLSNILLMVEGSTNRPVIVQSPADRSVREGSNTTFSVLATGDGPLRYQWQRNGVNLLNATNSSLSLSNLTVLQAGSYRASVSNNAGAVASAPALLTVLQTPLITVMPESRTNLAGTFTSFSVTAGGTTPLAYQWRFNGTNLPGATDATYSILSVQTNHAGNYAVVVTNAAGSATSTPPAALVVWVPPAILTSPQSRTNLAGTTASFTVAAVGAPSPSYQWRRNGTNLLNAGKVSGVTTPTLTLASVTTNDAAAYSVVITNIAGAITSSPSAVLTVWVLPTITTQPQSRTVMENANVTFTASATGTAPLSYQWLFNGSPLAGATGTSYTRTGVQVAHAGNYAVRVSNVAGQTNSASASLAVQYLRDSTFADTNLIRIRDFTTAVPYPSIIAVSTPEGVLSNVTVTLSRLSHTWPGDIDAIVVGPLGQKVMLMSDAGTYSVVDETFTFDDAASQMLPESDWLVGGTFKPTDYVGYDPTNDVFAAPAPAGPHGSQLAVFNGSDPNGTWSLFVRDDDGKDLGEIANGWKLGLRVLSTATGEQVPSVPPQILVGSATRLPDGRFQFTVTGTPSKVWELWGATNLPQFYRLQTLTNSSGTQTFTDPATNLPRRFYQVREQ